MRQSGPQPVTNLDVQSVKENIYGAINITWEYKPANAYQFAINLEFVPDDILIGDMPYSLPWQIGYMHLSRPDYLQRKVG